VPDDFEVVAQGIFFPETRLQEWITRLNSFTESSGTRAVLVGMLVKKITIPRKFCAYDPDNNRLARPCIV
jgi:hypothetical protein